MTLIGIMVDSKKTTISLSEDTKKQLGNFENKKGESYDDILQRVMKNADTLCAKKPQNNDVAAKASEKEE